MNAFKHLVSNTQLMSVNMVSLKTWLKICGLLHIFGFTVMFQMSVLLCSSSGPVNKQHHLKQIKLDRKHTTTNANVKVCHLVVLVFANQTWCIVIIIDEVVKKIHKRCCIYTVYYQCAAKSSSCKCSFWRLWPLNLDTWCWVRGQEQAERPSKCYIHCSLETHLVWHWHA